jgi:hypothetical protein
MVCGNPSAPPFPKATTILKPMSAPKVTVTITQGFTSDRSYAVGETVSIDPLNADNLIARGFAVAGEAEASPKPEPETRVRRKRRKLSEPQAGDDNA